MPSLEDIRRQAELEYEQELFREAVDSYKQKLRERRSLWDRIFPWKVIIIRKDRHV